MFRIIPEGLAYHEHVLLKDGQGVFLKPATDKDILLVGNFMKRISKESLRMRFMASISEVSATTIKNLCSGDFKQEGCLLAIIGEDIYKKVIGLGNYIATGNGHTAEVAFLIEDVYQGRGISTILLERLAGLAAANGFIDFEAEVLPDNLPMMIAGKRRGTDMGDIATARENCCCKFLKSSFKSENYRCHRCVSSFIFNWILNI